MPSLKKLRQLTAELHRAYTGGSESLTASPRDLNASIHPLREVVACLQLSLNLIRVHALVLRQILGVLPLEELHAILCIRLTPKVAIGSSLLIFGLAQRQRHAKCTWAAIKCNFDDIRDVISAQVALLRTISLHEDREGLCNTNGI